jgi:DNA-binding NtrC family response regulator
MKIILLVDDDPLQASFMLSVLGQNFGDVRRVTDASEALCLIEQPDFAGRLGLVISAHHTLRIGGPAFVSEVRARKPNLPVLVLGAIGETAAEYAETDTIFLATPFASERMLTLTRQILADHEKAAA